MTESAQKPAHNSTHNPSASSEPLSEQHSGETDASAPASAFDAVDSGTHAAANPADELSQALGELTLLKAREQDLKDQLLRAAADVQNVRRRAEEDVSKARKFAIESFAESLLPVIDSLEAGLAIKDATAEQIKEGSEATLRQLKAALERNKVVAIDPPVGEKFDSTKHQGISTVPSEQEPNTIVAVLQKGYVIAERVIRPALVTVSAAK